MSKVYLYRKHLREPWKLFICIWGMFIFGYGGMMSIILSSNDELKDDASIVFGIAGLVVSVIILIEFAILYFIMFRRFKKVKVELSENEIIYNNFKGKTVIPYNEITKLKFPSIKYLGGWVKIIYNNKNVKITVVLEDIGDLLANLKEKLDSIGKQVVYDEKKLYSFYKTASYSDGSWGRIYDYIKKVFAFIICNFVVVFGFSKLTDDIDKKFKLFLSFIIFSLLIYIICEIVLGRKLSKQANEESFYVPNRDKQLEAKVYKYGLIIYSIIYIAASALIVFVL